MKRTIAIAGNMGTGKSTLVEFLHRTYGVSPFYEPNDDNPYLADFYRDMKRWAFQSQLYFLSNKFRLHQELDRQPGGSPNQLLLFQLGVELFQLGRGKSHQEPDRRVDRLEAVLRGQGERLARLGPHADRPAAETHRKLPPRRGILGGRAA